MSQIDLVEILHDIRLQLYKRGQSSLRQLGVAFRLNDKDTTGIFDFEEIELIFGKIGLFLKRQQLTKLYRYFDRQQNEQIYYPEILTAIKGELSTRRFNMINHIFNVLDVKQRGGVDIQYIFDTYNARTHPQVLSGEKNIDAVTKDFILAFEGCGANNNGLVLRDEFIDYYWNISAAVPYDDDFFISQLERVWNTKEPRDNLSVNVHGVDRSLLRKVQHVLQEKIRQRSNSTKSESESLRLTFKHFDSSDSGTVTYKQFLQGLERFGIVMDSKITRSLFDDFARDERVNYAEFVATLYELDDTVATAYKKQQTAQIIQSNNKREYLDTGKLLVSAPYNAQNDFNRSLNNQPVNIASPKAENVPTIVFVVGGPGVGKEAQCAKIVGEFGFVHLSVGDLLRKELEDAKSQYGAVIYNFVKDGKIVPSQITITLIDRVIQYYVQQGHLYFLIDGFPRNNENWSAWNQIIGPRYNVEFVLFLDAPFSTLEQRLINRSGTSRRSDDNVEGIKKRLKTYETETLPIVEQLGREGLLRVVSAEGNTEQTYSEVRKIIGSL